VQFAQLCGHERGSKTSIDGPPAANLQEASQDIFIPTALTKKRKHPAQSKLLAPKTTQNNRVATSFGRIVKSGKDTNAQAVCELEPDKRSVPAEFAQSMNWIVPCVAPMMIARIPKIKLALIFTDHFLFELAKRVGIPELELLDYITRLTPSFPNTFASFPNATTTRAYNRPFRSMTIT
jgi:hypothetical protein